MREIQLTQGRVALVDDEDFEYLSKFNWHIRPMANTYYAERATLLGLDRIKGQKKKMVSMHRQVLKNASASQKIDHIDGNGLNNQKANLRFATTSQNAMNKRKSTSRDYQTKYKGVYREKDTAKFRARICVDGTPKSLGYYRTQEEAAIAYNHAAIRLFGEYAYLNKIEQQ